MMQNFRLLLLPLSWVYGLTVRMRNALYRRGWFKSQRAVLPTVIIGNITVGGTGKSPHTRWLVEQLSTLQPAILSRGYGRTTRGFYWVQNPRASTGAPAEVPNPKIHGDEPVMYANTLSSTPVAVCEDRLEGVRRIAETSTAQCVILDDALQHRRLRGDVLLALLRFDQLPHSDHYLPAGNLRDHRSRLNDVDAILITHCGDQSRDEIHAHAHPSLPDSSAIPVFISRTRYGALKQVSGDPAVVLKRVIVVTAIAQSAPLLEHLQKQFQVAKHFKYRDHHTFEVSEIAQWQAALHTFNADGIITTEKDYVRLKDLEHDLPVFIQPIELAIDKSDDLKRLIGERLEQSLTRVV